jgi:hypothetical protein
MVSFIIVIMSGTLMTTLGMVILFRAVLQGDY